MAAKLVNVESIGSYFESLSDPRHTRNRRHLLVDVIVIAVCGMVCGCDGPTAIHRWAANRLEWLEQFLALPHGVPSRDCLRRLLIRLQPEAFQKCFQQWIAEAVPTDEDGPARLIAIDGKTCRRSHDASQGLGALHIVSAWASEEGIALGQVATEEKSNEITAIPQLLEQIDLTHSLITIDAMGCQKEIAEKIVKGGGDFVLAVKDNQPKLHRAIKNFFAEHLEKDLEDLQYRYHETEEEGHGRLDERAYYLARVPSDFALQKAWPWVKAIGYAVRMTQHADGSSSVSSSFSAKRRICRQVSFSRTIRNVLSHNSETWTSRSSSSQRDQPKAIAKAISKSISSLSTSFPFHSSCHTGQTTV